MKIKDLTPADYNPRKINDKQLQSLKRSMAEFGDLSGIVVNTRTGNIVGGHQRVKNLEPDWTVQKQKMNDDVGTVYVGHIETPWGRWVYREVDWPGEKEKAANIAANKHGGSWDLEKLNMVINDLKEINFDIELTGFEAPEINRLEKHAGGEGKDDGSPSLDGFVYQVVVTVNDEAEQGSLIDELEERGMKCQPLML